MTVGVVKLLPAPRVCLPKVPPRAERAPWLSGSQAKEPLPAYQGPRRFSQGALAAGIVGCWLSALGGLPVFAAATGVVVEAESGALANAMRAYASPSASGGACIQVVSTVRQDDPTALATPDARYVFTIPATDSYKVYLRAFAPSTSADSYHYRWDGGSYENRGATVAPAWIWQETGAKTLAAGVHTLDICYRESGFCLDLLVVAKNLTPAEKAAIDAASVGVARHPNASTAASFNGVDGSVLFEAEQATLNASVFGPTADAAAGNGTALSALADQSTVPEKSAVGLEFNVRSDRAGKYDVWIRYSASSAQNRLYLAVDDGPYAASTLTATGPNPSAYAWQKLQATAEQLFAGEKYNFKLYPAKAGLRIDQVAVTSYPFFNPTGVVTTLDNLAFQFSLPASAYPQPPLTPPATHPRLYFQAADIAGIKAKMTKGQNTNARVAYQRLLDTPTDGILGATIFAGGMNYNADTLAIIEASALKYAFDADVAYGHKAITAIKNLLRTLELDDSIQDITRQMGHVIFVASAVYDWCHPLLTPADKNYLIVACEAIAKRMEVGYPPSKQGAITGHAGEAQLFRDLLSLGIATYDERPDIYHYVAGRLWSQFIEPRDYWYRSHTHHQGDSYGNYRYAWEMVFQWILRRLTGQTVFSAEGEFVPYQWIYARRPDGQMFRDGDNYQEPGATLGTYWKNDLTATFYSANFYGNRFVKAQYIATDPTFTGSAGNGLLTPVSYLLFNDPDLAGQSHAPTFPLTKYFGPPQGMMMARTGWIDEGGAQVQLDSKIAMAQMTIGEQWAANHQHLDAGSFQLYYKGALASESGIYDSYGTSEDRNYNKETIAHNALLIADPTEVPLQAVNSGGQRRPGGEMSTFAAWMNSGYDRGKVLDQGYDPAGRVPQYSYIKGDITRAYTTKVAQVLRSMLFMPLDDARHPAALVVMDKVTAANPAFKKTWLLHTQQDPVLAGPTAIIKRDTHGYDGRMDLTSLLPRGAVMTKIGGVGNEFSVNGVHYPPLTYGGAACEYGTWRIEVSPASAANATDYFLHVMQVSDASAKATPLEATLIETDDLAGLKIANRVAMFSKGRERLSGTIAFTIPGSESGGLKVVVAGVQAGIWNIYQGTTGVAQTAATAEGGVIFFDGGRAGPVRLLPAGSDPSAILLPAITRQPGGDQSVNLGAEVAFSVSASSAPPISYQWFTNATPISGATHASLLLPRVRPSDAGSYTVVVTNAAGSVTSAAARLTVAFSRLINLSVLAPLATPGDTLTLGYVMGGTGTAGTTPLLVRAAGPSLGPLGVAGPLADPKIEFFAGATKTGENDNWAGAGAVASAMAAVGAFAYTGPTSRDAAVVLTVAGGDNSVRVSAADNGTGRVIAELYDANPAAGLTGVEPRLVNASVLQQVGTGFTAGFVVGGTSVKHVLIRAVGPTLGSAFGVGGAVSDPQLTLNSGPTAIATNDNWGGGATLGSAFASVGAFALPANSRDAAVMASLHPGNYTVQVSGVGGANGLVLVEIYELP